MINLKKFQNINFQKLEILNNLNQNFFDKEI
jgi:hypothetical protein